MRNPGSKTQSSYIELNSQRLKENIEFVKNLLEDGVEISAVVKGNAYGHGIHEFVPLAEAEGISHFSVYGVEEAMGFSETAHPQSQLMIMGYVDEENLAWVMKNEYEFFVYDIYQLELASKLSSYLGIPARIHLEIETGMNRTGISPEFVDQAIEIIKETGDGFILNGCCTHYAGAESFSNYYRIKRQIIRFEETVKHFERSGVHFKKKHTACSAALVRYPGIQYDMVRVGILLYGFWPSRETLVDYMTRNNLTHDPLTAIISWKTVVMSVKDVESGEYVGYGTSFLTNRPTRIAIIPVGYAHGYARSLSNYGRVLVHGQRVTVIGTVNMNLMMIDVTEVEGVERGDEVVLIGFQGNNRISVSSFGEMSSQMNYELLARLPQSIPRLTI
ncbi:MAG TPA: alanine racemase [Cryomorphaceae bacterium]|nr:alanine racemase [Cryomorphaceae bacterium]